MSLTKTHLDNEQYWIDRHKKYDGNILSVGHLGYDEATNNQWHSSKRKALQASIRKSFSQTEHLSVLELGCGIGELAPAILELNFQYMGLDISERAVQIAKQRYPQGEFLCQNIIDFQMDKKFDLVFATDVLVHIVDDQHWRETLSLAISHLKPSGQIILREELTHSIRNPAQHVVRRSIQEYSEFLLKQGYQISLIFQHDSFYLVKK